MGCHSLADGTLHAGEADAVLVLEQLADGTNTTIAEVVDIVVIADPVLEMHVVVYGSDDIFLRDVLRNQLADALLDRICKGFRLRVVLILQQDLAKFRIVHLLGNAKLLRIAVHEVGDVDHQVREHLHAVALLRLNPDVRNGCILDLFCHLAGNGIACGSQNIAVCLIDHILCKDMSGDAVLQSQLLVELIAAHLGHVVAAGVEKQGLKIRLSVFHRGGLARAQSAVDLKQALFFRVAGVLLDGGCDALVLTEHIQDLLVGVHAQGADQAGDGELAVFVDADVEDVLRVGFIFKPGAAVRNDGGSVGVLVGLVDLVAVVHTGASDDLRDDDALRAVDHEGAAVGHQREIAHEDLLLFDLAGLFVAQPHADLDGLGVGGVALFALFDGVLGLVVHAVVEEAQLEITGVVGNGVDVLEYLMQSLVEEPLIGVLLDLQKVGHLKDLFVLGIALAQGFAEQFVFHQCHLKSSQPFLLFCVF